MPRKGWSTVQVPDGWLKVIRGPRPPATKWPKVQHSTQPQGGRRDTQPVRNQQQERQRAPVDPDTAMANARARMSKLEAAMSAVGEEDPMYPGLLEAFKKVRAQTQTKPVQDRIAGTELFLERGRKRVEGCRQDVEKAREALVAAEAKLLSEEDASQAEDRLRVLRQEAAAGGVQESPPATIPANFAQELAQLRDFVSELQRERDELRTELVGRAHPSEEDEQVSVRTLIGIGTSSEQGWFCRARERERSLHHDGNVDRSSGECSEVRFIGNAHEPLVSERDARFGHRESHW